MSKLSLWLNSVGIQDHKGKIDEKWSNFDHILPIFAWSFPCDLEFSYLNDIDITYASTNRKHWNLEWQFHLGLFEFWRVNYTNIVSKWSISLAWTGLRESLFQFRTISIRCLIMETQNFIRATGQESKSRPMICVVDRSHFE